MVVRCSRLHLQSVVGLKTIQTTRFFGTSAKSPPQQHTHGNTVPSAIFFSAFISLLLHMLILANLEREEIGERRQRREGKGREGR
jgi:hypothetical protein